MELPVDLRLHARLDRARRGRPDAPADRAPRRAARHPEYDGDPPGRRERDGRGLAAGARAAPTGPTALVLTRQKLPVLDRDGVAPSDGVERGALRAGRRRGGEPRRDPDRHRLGGPLCLGRAELLAADGVAPRVVSMPCWDLFAAAGRRLPRRRSCRPRSPARVSVEAGVDVRLGSLGRRRGRRDRHRPLRRLGAGERDLRGLRLRWTPSPTSPSVSRRKPGGSEASGMRFACGFDHGGYLAATDDLLDALRRRPRARRPRGDRARLRRRLPRLRAPRWCGRSSTGMPSGDPRLRLRCRGGGRRRRRSRASGPRWPTTPTRPRQCVEHDDCNVLALGARVIGPEIASRARRAPSPTPSSAARSDTCDVSPRSTRSSATASTRSSAQPSRSRSDPQ